MIWRTARAVLGGLVGVYLLGGALLYAMQDRLMYPAPGGIGRDALDAAAAEIGAQTLRLRAADGVQVYAWQLSSGNDRVVLYLHGNGEALPDNAPLYRLLLRNGWDVVALAYRGYPGSEAVAPTEEGLALDAAAAWRWIVELGGYTPERVVVHGRSLGGAVGAILVEGDANPAALVLESTFVNATALAHRAAPIYPVSWLLRDTYDTQRLAPRLGVPVLVLHSRDDQLVPLELSAVALAPFIAEVEVHETSGIGHESSLPAGDTEIQAAWLRFLDRRVPAR